MGPFVYDWSNNGSGQDINGLSSGTYILEVTDSKGCSAVAEMFIDEPSELTASATAQDDEQCNNCLNISASGGTSPYEYSSDGVDYQSSDVKANMITRYLGQYHTFADLL